MRHLAAAILAAALLLSGCGQMGPLYMPEPEHPPAPPPPAAEAPPAGA